MFLRNKATGMAGLILLAEMMGMMAGCSKAQNPPAVKTTGAPGASDNSTISPTPNDAHGINSVHAIDLPGPIAPAGMPLGNPGIAMTPPAANVMASTPD